MLCLTSTILASTLTIPIITTQAYADNMANTDTTLKINNDVQLSVTAPTVINYKLEPDGTFICPTDATIKNNSSIPIATKSWTTNIHAGTAVSKNDFEGSSTSNTWWNTVSADGGESSPFNLDTKTLYDSWNMAASGQSLNDTQDDTLLLAFDGGMKNIDGLIDYNTGKQLSTITFTFGTMLNEKEPEPQPDPENGVAFAVYSADDNSLDFYKRDSFPSVGKKFMGKTTTKLYKNIEELNPSNSLQTPWDSNKKEIIEINIIDSGIKPISLKGWFWNMPNLENAYVKKLDVSNCSTLHGTFMQDWKLKALNVSDWDISNVTSVEGFVSRCTSLTAIEGLSTWNTSNIKNFNNLFFDCYSLRSLDLSGWDMSKWESRNIYGYSEGLFAHDSEVMAIETINLDGAILPTNCDMFFNDLGHLKNVHLNNVDVSHIINMKGMFTYCPLNDFSFLRNWDVSNVTNMTGMFYGCTLTDADIIPLTSWNTSSVTSMNSLFGECSNLNDFTPIQNWDTSQVTNMSYMFSDCSSLESLDLSNWDTSRVTNMSYMFDNCSSLKLLDLSNWDTSNVTNSKTMFNKCNDLITLDISNWNMQNMPSIPTIPSNIQSINAKNVILPKNCSSLYNNFLKYLSSDWATLDTSHVTDMSYMFSGTSLIDLSNIQNWDTSRVTNMSYMFSDCSSLESLDLSNWDTSQVISIICMFNNCSTVTNLDLTNWDVSNVVDMTGTFKSCINLQNINGISNWNTTSLQWTGYTGPSSEGGTFADCPNLTADLSNWDVSNVDITNGEPYAFANGASKVTVPNAWKTMLA